MNTNNIEENLTWLQEFHVNKIRFLIKDDKYIDDETAYLYLERDHYKSLGQNLPDIKFCIYTINDEEWSLEFRDQTKQISDSIPIIIQYLIQVRCRKDYYNSFSDALYLNLAIECFKSCINKTDLLVANSPALTRDLYRHNNPLLSWIEEFYCSCVNTGWEYDRGVAVGLVATSDGWLFYFSILYLDLENKSFESIIISEPEDSVSCYKAKYMNDDMSAILDCKFYIRAHARGLITGLKIFKDWIES